MRSKLLFLMLAAGLLYFPETAQADDNLAPNPSFEEGTWVNEDSVPDNWGIWDAGGGDGTWHQDPEGAYDGDYYMGFIGGTWPSAWAYEGAEAWPCTPGETWYVGAYVKGSTTDTGNFQTTYEGGSTAFINNSFIPPSETEWTYVELEVVVPAGATATGFAIAGFGTSSELFFDNVWYSTGPGPPGSSRGTAINIYPPDGVEYIPPSAVLEWGPPLDYDPNAYDVYLTTDPNANKPEHLVVDGVLQTTYDPPGDLDFNTWYYWRVNSYDPCCTEPSCWPTEGGVWSFKTMPAEPLFTTDAAHTVVAAGGSAEFSVVSPNADLGFKWYKEPATLLNDGDDGGDISIVSDATSSTLTISDVEQADEDFYYCVAENSYDTTESAHARLEIAELLAHWTLDSPLVADQYVDETGNHNADPNNPAGVSFTGGKIAEAVEMNDQRWANAGSWRPNEYGGQMTVSSWFKIPDTEDIDGDGQGIASKREGDSFDWALYVRNGDGWHPDDNYVRFTSWNGGDVWGSLDAVSDDWVYAAATVDSTGTARIYVNGIVQDVADDFEFGANEDADILIGKGNPDQYVFPGLIDDVKIYNYARDAYEIAADYTDVTGGTVCVYESPVDYNGDCKVDLADVAEVALIWHNCNIIPASACP